MPVMLLAGILGGMVWAAIPAFLRTRFNTNEILMTLMLVYIAQLALSFLVHGPWRDPAGHNFPQSEGFGDAETCRCLLAERGSPGVHLRLGLALVAWFFSTKDVCGFPNAGCWAGARRGAYAGFSRKAQHLDCTHALRRYGGPRWDLRGRGPDRTIAAQISPGYGFAAIIVAWVGRLHPIGVVFGGPVDVAALPRWRSRRRWEWVCLLRSPDSSRDCCSSICSPQICSSHSA